jgi:hypothetical protein
MSNSHLSNECSLRLKGEECCACAGGIGFFREGVDPSCSHVQWGKCASYCHAVFCDCSRALAASQCEGTRSAWFARVPVTALFGHSMNHEGSISLACAAQSRALCAKDQVMYTFTDLRRELATIKNTITPNFSRENHPFRTCRRNLCKLCCGVKIDLAASYTL